VTLRSFWHFLKASAPIDVTLEGISTEVRAVPTKEALPIVLTLVGMTKSDSDVQALKAESGIALQAFDQVADLRASSFPKQLSPTDVTVSGMIMEVNLGISLKASFSMAKRPFGNVTEVRGDS
jgi:hypothetical protein